MGHRSTRLSRAARWAAVAAVGVLAAGTAATAAPRAASDASGTPSAGSGSAAPRYDEMPAARAWETAFVLDRGRWPSPQDITYRIVSGTADIRGVDQRAEIRAALGLWQATGRVRFREVSTVADIEFSFGTGEHGDGLPFDGVGRVLAHGFFPPPTNANPIAGNVHFDDDEKWTVASRQNGAQPIDLQTVAAHEVGHALGLRHSADTTSLMTDLYTGSHRILSTDDLNGIRAAYP